MILSLSSGVLMGIPYKDLPDEVQKRFQFDLEDAAVYQARLNKATGIRIAQGKESDKKKKNAQAEMALIEKGEKAKTLVKSANNKFKEARRLRKSAGEWDKKANGYRRQETRARRAGRVSSMPAQIRRAEGTARNLRKRADAAQDSAEEMIAESKKIERELRDARD